MIKRIINWFLAPFRKLRRRYIIAKANVKMEKAYQKQLKERKSLREKINEFLYEFFGIDAKSKYIPRDFKNKEEVRVAVCEKFGDQMKALNVTYSDIFS